MTASRYIDPQRSLLNVVNSGSPDATQTLHTCMRTHRLALTQHRAEDRPVRIRSHAERRRRRLFSGECYIPSLGPDSTPTRDVERKNPRSNYAARVSCFAKGRILLTGHNAKVLLLIALGGTSLRLSTSAGLSC